MSQSLEIPLGWLSLMTVLCILAVEMASAAETAGTAVSSQGPPVDVKSVAEANNRFALDLYGKLKKGDENLFYSPYSISTALAMTYAGARGDHGRGDGQDSALRPARRSPAPGLCGGLIRDLNEAGKKGDFQLSVANRLWGQKGERF